MLRIGAKYRGILTLSQMYKPLKIIWILSFYYMPIINLSFLLKKIGIFAVFVVVVNRNMTCFTHVDVDLNISLSPITQSWCTMFWGQICLFPPPCMLKTVSSLSGTEHPHLFVTLSNLASGNKKRRGWLQILMVAILSWIYLAQIKSFFNAATPQLFVTYFTHLLQEQILPLITQPRRHIQNRCTEARNIDSGWKSSFSPKTQHRFVSSILVCALQVIKRLSTKQNPECYAQTNRIV